jgi:hypothetical protein
MDGGVDNLVPLSPALYGQLFLWMQRLPTPALMLLELVFRGENIFAQTAIIFALFGTFEGWVGASLHVSIEFFLCSTGFGTSNVWARKG